MTTREYLEFQFNMANIVLESGNNVPLYFASVAEYFASVYGNHTFKDSIIKGSGLEAYKQAVRDQRSKKARTRRIRNRVADIVLSDKAFFVTLTFRDSVFAKTSMATRRTYVRKFLSSLRGAGSYVANIDFGEQKGREHYHAIICTSDGVLPDLSSWYQKCGAYNVEKIKSKFNDLTCVSKYLTKLTCHAIKESTGKAYRIIYSR